MPHDFAKQREARANRSSKPPIAPWIWFSSGAVIGAFCSFLLFLAVGVPQPQTTRVSEAKTSDAKSKAKPSAKTESKTKFEFYTMLMESEVAAGSSNGNASVAPGVKPAPSAESTTPSVYQLQAGAFRQLAPAEQKRAEITLENFAARVEHVSIPHEGEWYRVLVGPFATAEEQANARRLLLERGVTTLEISKRSK